jgi:hypothetical protein
LLWIAIPIVILLILVIALGWITSR